MSQWLTFVNESLGIDPSVPNAPTSSVVGGEDVVIFDGSESADAAMGKARLGGMQSAKTRRIVGKTARSVA